MRKRINVSANISERVGFYVFMVPTNWQLIQIQLKAQIETWRPSIIF